MKHFYMLMLMNYKLWRDNTSVKRNVFKSCFGLQIIVMVLFLGSDSLFAGGSKDLCLNGATGIKSHLRSGTETAEYPLFEHECTEDVEGENFSLSDGESVTFNQPATNYGFQFDIYTLDNSFNLNINGVDLATQELEFQSSGTSGINVRFQDGDEYETDTEGDIWEMNGTASAPLIRVVISPSGTISMFGSKTSGGSLEPLELFNGNTFNTISWNSASSNTIVGSQSVVGTTYMTGYGSGKNIIPCDPNISLEKTGTFNDTNGNGYADTGETITYGFVVTNIGNVMVTNITINDPLPGIVLNGGPINLEPEASDNGTFTATYTITQADVDNGSVTNQATATGQDPDNNNVSDDSDDPTDTTDDDPDGDGDPDDETVTQLNQDPGLTVTKTATSNENTLGGTITYEIVVANTGNVTLTNIEVTDNNAAITGGSPITSLSVGESTTVTAEHTITQDDLNVGYVENTAVATGDSPSGTDDVTDSSDAGDETTETPDGSGNTDGDPTNDPTVTQLNQSPELTVTKTATSNENTLGGTITYEIVVANTGDVTLTNIEVTDNNAAITGGSPITSLSVGESATVTAEHTITQADIDAGYVENTAVATGDSPSGTDDVTDSSDAGDETTETPDGSGNTDGDPTNDPTVTQLNQNPELTVTKTATGNGNTLGSTITYEIVVANTGDVTLTNIEVTDNNATITGGSPITSLSVGESATVTAEHTITQTDIDAGYVENTAVATGDSPNGTDDVTDSSDAGDETTETPDGSGNTDGDPTNDPTVTQLNQNPELTVTKTATGNGNTLGSTITYEIVVANTGDVTLTNIEVTDNNAAITGGSPITNLGVGESATVMASHTITQDDLDVGYVENTAMAAGDSPNGTDDVTDSSDAGDETTETPDGSGNTDGDPTNDPTVTNISKEPSMALVKTAIFNDENGDTYAQEGETITYTFIVTNIGNVRMESLVINDEQLGITELTIEPQSLNPGETGMITADYTITTGDIDVGSVSNTALAEGLDPEGNPVTDISGTATDNDEETITALLVITIEPPMAANDEATTQMGQPVTITIITNDSGNGAELLPTSIEVVTPPQYGTVSVNENGQVVYTPNKGSKYVGEDTFTYRVQDENGNWTNMAMVTVTIEGLFIPNVITPNGDGKNDTFEIIGIDSNSKAKIIIYNRWGNEVYKNYEYDNSFGGHGLNEGTYFYQLSLIDSEGNDRQYTGWIFIKR
ncbi:gliding motility-associated C-terminal domain-containing protein [Galbibacter sp. EGI 63066]|uniref:DUF7507 domain-containing protein n=1 Tax=Galbibacter sp. EGI 63066 TaxID=2993559 RepID=UPI002248BED7|nr:gliding motility-associated C-terminal domain-containing protein [Galbibacter sp. EGI 63066]MCX2681606.1 gliding motility-associated C-terminal domain-containing protein [Galbibacter sp. EGI 63066]